MLVESMLTFFVRCRVCLETTRCASRTCQLDSTSWTNIQVQKVFLAATSVSDTADEFETSLLEIEKIAQMLVKTLRGGTPNEHRSH